MIQGVETAFVIFSYRSFKSVLPKLKHVLYSLRLDVVSLGQTNIYCIWKHNFLKMSLKMDVRECRLALKGQSQILELSYLTVSES